MLLYDLIKQRGYSVPDCPVFEISNVAEFCKQARHWEEWGESELLKISDAIPPGLSFFMEWEDPEADEKDTVLDADVGMLKKGLLWSVAKSDTGKWVCKVAEFRSCIWFNSVHCDAQPRAYMRRSDETELFDMMVQERKLACEGTVADRGKVHDLPEAIRRFRARCPIFQKFHVAPVDGLDPEYLFAFSLTADGQFDLSAPYYVSGGVSNLDRLWWAVSNMLLPCLQAMMFMSMHARSVQKVEQQSPRHERRQAEHAGHPPLTKFYVLEIRGVGQHHTRAVSVGTSGERSFHICRGHRRKYTEDGPLFGKYVGVFWIASHTRGSKDVGEIKKTYSVTVPEMGRA